MLKLEVYVGETDKAKGKPLWKAVLKKLQQEDIAGASTFKGIAGYGAGGEIHFLEVLRLSEDTPVKVVAVDEEKKIRAALPEVESMVQEGLILIQEVDAEQKGTPKKS